MFESLITHTTDGWTPDQSHKLQAYNVKPYCELFLPFKHRSALAKFECDVAPLRLETRRYEG